MTEWKTSIESSRSGYEGNIKMNYEETGRENGKCMHLTQEMDIRRDPWNKRIKFWFS
jgi:hypothetical protein